MEWGEAKFFGAGDIVEIRLGVRGVNEVVSQGQVIEFVGVIRTVGWYEVKVDGHLVPFRRSSDDLRLIRSSGMDL